MRMKMLCLTIRIKRNDELQGKRLHKVLLDFLIQNKIARCHGLDWSSFLKGVGDALGPSDEHVRTLPFNSATNIKHSTH